MKKIVGLFVLILTFITRQGYAQEEGVLPFEEAYKRVYHIEKLRGEKPPVIDGKLDDAIWNRHGEWSAPFVQVIPREREKTESPTYVKLFYDDKNIYVGIRCEDPEPESINRFIGNRDDNSLGDLVSIAFDTYHDFRAAPEFNINAGGNKTDLIVTDKLDVNRSWNAVWEGRTHVDVADSCWTVEIRIPFSQLRYNQHANDSIWGLHVRRIIRRNSETQNWSLIPLRNNGHVFSFGEMHGMKDLPKPRGIEFLPYTMGKFQAEPKIPGSPYQKGEKWGGNIGMDAKLALSDFTLDLTVNPDFGQVELDPSVMNLTAFETFYEEKRPFFLEGKHILDFAADNDMMFYTRRIGASPSYTPVGINNETSFAETMENVPIIGALKLTGTNRKGVTIGLLQSATAQSSVKVRRAGDTSKEIVEPFTSYTIARLQKNWKGNTLLGGMITSVNRNLNREHLKNQLIGNAFVGGIDFTHYFKDRLYYVDMKGMFSSLHGSRNAIALLQLSPVHYYQRMSAADYLGVDANRRSLNGTGGHVTVGRKGNAKWTFSETFRWRSPGFDLNDVGYLKQADFMENETEVIFKYTDIWRIFRSNTLTFSQENRWDYGGNAIDNDVAVEWKTMFLNRFELTAYESFGWRHLDTRQLRGGPDMRYDPYFYTSLSFNTDKAKRVMFQVKYQGDHNTDGYNMFNTLSPSLNFRLGNRVYLTGQFDYSWNTDNLQYIGRFANDRSGDAASGNSDIYLMGKMDQKTYGMTLKMQVNVTPDISIQAYASPFTSTGRFDNFKKAADTRSSVYDHRFHAYASGDVTPTDAGYRIKTDTDMFEFSQPNFSFNEFRSNIVGRWEYLPGSTLYLVWELRMSDRHNRYISGLGNNLDRMFGLPSTNTFMIKLNYWFNL